MGKISRAENTAIFIGDAELKIDTDKICRTIESSRYQDIRLKKKV